jgi:hypothetical protein
MYTVCRYKYMVLAHPKQTIPDCTYKYMVLAHPKQTIPDSLDHIRLSS